MIAIIDYGLGNLGSIKNALNRLNVTSRITDKVVEINNAKGIIFPGVGAANAGIKNLKLKEVDKIICNQITNGKPILGICLGMQLLFSSSEEGNTKCLNIIKGKVKKFNTDLKVPQIGWNQVRFKPSKLFAGINNDNYFYFANSYYCQPKDKKIVTGITNYGINFCSAIETNNIFGVQFHPEKSGKIGQQLIKNWLNLC